MDAPSFSIDQRRSFALFAGFENQGRTPFAFEASLLFALPLPFTFAKLFGDNQGTPKSLVSSFHFAFSWRKVLLEFLVCPFQSVDHFKHLLDIKYKLHVFVLV